MTRQGGYDGFGALSEGIQTFLEILGLLVVEFAKGGRTGTVHSALGLAGMVGRAERSG